MKSVEIVLEELGFSKAEISIYLALLKLGESKVGEIIKQSKVSSSNTHDCLDKLANKGVISYILKNSIKYFYPTKPENLKLILKNQRDLIDRKEKDLDTIIPELALISNKEIITQGAEIFFGFNGLKNAFKKFVDPIMPNDISYFFHKVNHEDIEMVNQFYSKLELDGDYNNVEQRGLASLDFKEYFEKRKNSRVKMKYTNHPIPSSINFYSDKTLLISWSKEPVAFLIKSENITKTFKKLFDEIWDLELK